MRQFALAAALLAATSAAALAAETGDGPLRRSAVTAAPGADTMRVDLDLGAPPPGTPVYGISFTLAGKDGARDTGTLVGPANRTVPVQIKTVTLYPQSATVTDREFDPFGLVTLALGKHVEYVQGEAEDGVSLAFTAREGRDGFALLDTQFVRSRVRGIRPFVEVVNGEEVALALPSVDVQTMSGGVEARLDEPTVVGRVDGDDGFVLTATVRLIGRTPEQIAGRD
jgi:hypothetical protein